MMMRSKIDMEKIYNQAFKSWFNYKIRTGVTKESLYKEYRECVIKVLLSELNIKLDYITFEGFVHYYDLTLNQTLKERSKYINNFLVEDNLNELIEIEFKKLILSNEYVNKIKLIEHERE